MGNLAGDRPPANAWEDTRCLACHTTPAAVNDPGEAALSRREHGVTCDACHGPAERWDHRHLRWNTSADRGKEYRDAGAVWLNDPVSRAQVCAGCHVGAPPDTDHNLPAREVNHDLIAAGHPRLTFELSLFLANLPPHWDEIDRTQPRRVRREPGAAHTWLAGQLGTAQASLRLLAHQAHPGPAGSPPAPWPELAQLDCYACHHGLSGTGSRPALGPRGSLSPNAWNLSWPLRRVLEQDDPESARGIDQLREALARPTDRAAVAERARGLAVRIGHRLDTLRTDLAGMTPEHVLAAFRAGAGQLDRLDWDDAAQLLYALEALRGLAPDEQALRSALTHPGNADSPTEFRPTDPARRLRQSLNRRPDG
jgi:hypothetical protein